MKFNTIPFKNIDTNVFVGRFEGEDYTIQAEETRYFPSHVSEHFAKQLMETLFSAIQRNNKQANKVAIEEEIRGKILGEEILTAEKPVVLSMKQQVLEHEASVKEMFAEEERKKKATEIEAMKIIIEE